MKYRISKIIKEWLGYHFPLKHKKYFQVTDYFLLRSQQPFCSEFNKHVGLCSLCKLCCSIPRTIFNRQKLLLAGYDSSSCYRLCELIHPRALDRIKLLYVGGSLYLSITYLFLTSLYRYLWWQQLTPSLRFLQTRRCSAQMKNYSKCYGLSRLQRLHIVP